MQYFGRQAIGFHRPSIVALGSGRIRMSGQSLHRQQVFIPS